MRVKARRGASSFLRRPIQRLYPFEVQHKKGTTENNSTTENNLTTESNSITTIEQSSGIPLKKRITQLMRMCLSLPLIVFYLRLQ